MPTCDHHEDETIHELNESSREFAREFCSDVEGEKSLEEKESMLLNLLAHKSPEEQSKLTKSISDYRRRSGGADHTQSLLTLKSKLQSLNKTNQPTVQDFTNLIKSNEHIYTFGIHDCTGKKRHQSEHLAVSA